MTPAAISRDVTGDLSHLPDHAMGARNVVWWGTLGFMLIEGTAFVLAAGAALYLAGQGGGWPPPGTRPPDLLWGTVFTAGLVLSALPNRWLEKKAEAQDEDAVRRGLLLMSLIAAVLLAVRALELQHLNVRWDANAYGSAQWMLMLLHISHVITDLGDTVVITLWFFTHKPGPSQYFDAADNAGYWNFVILTWLPLYALIYWGPRLL